ncbi:MAG: hypothetical protein IKE27_04900 [Oscillospiraceae bacterium]|nr:hypothetical protein [Oscillospiraceae bacterium]
MMITFTDAEKELISLFRGSSRIDTICALQNTLPEIKDEKMVSTIKSVLSKLLRIDSIRYEQLCLS